MTKKNLYTPLENLPSEEDVKKLVSDGQYKKIETSQLPEPIIENGLVGKFNSVVVCASGNTESMLYSFIGIRPDKGDVVDEHPIVLCYNQLDASKSFGGIIHHGDWDGRTIPLEQWQIAAIEASGLTANFSYKSIPPNSSGFIIDLSTNGMLNGLSKQFEVLYKNTPQ